MGSLSQAGELTGHTVQAVQWTVIYCTVWCTVVQYSTVQYNTVEYSTVSKV